jgi:hypothetical protein
MYKVSVTENHSFYARVVSEFLPAANFYPTE